MFGLTLDETLAHQEDLEQLCQERRQAKIEIFRGNAFYGIDQILKTYADLPLDYALKGIVPHGIYLSEDFVWLEEIFSPLPAIFYSTDHAQANYKNHLKKHHLHKQLYPFSSPFLYLIDLYKEIPKPDRKGTLFFLSHSTHRITAEADIDAIISQLKGLDEIYQPVTICLYWRDYQLGRHKPFQDHGFQVVSAGHMYDPLFMPRLYHLLSIHQYAAGNEVGSHLFYATKTGCPYFLIDVGETVRTADDPKVLAWSLASVREQRIQTIHSLFCKPSPTITPEQQELVDYYMGAQYFQSPDLLKQQLIDLEDWYELAQETQRYFQIPSPPVSKALEAVPSEVSLQERQFLYHFFGRFWQGDEDVLEIGPFLGGTTRAIALGMATNSKRQPQTKLYSCDRFHGYYDSQRLSNYLQPVFEQGLLPDELKAKIQQSDQFLEVFQAFHEGQSYADFLVARNQVLPNFLDEVETLEHRFEPPETTFGAVFVDGCKSWYGTKYFLLKMAPHVHQGTFFLFQDYGWYTCFWIPLIVKGLEDYFEPIAHVGGTYGFRLIQDLSEDAIATRLPDALSVADRPWIDRAFTELFLQAHNNQDSRAMTTYTLQHGAALTYLGLLDDAKAKMIPLLTQPWTKGLESKVLEALKFPTYDPNHHPIPLFSEQDYRQLLATQANLDSFYSEFEELKKQNAQLAKRLDAATTQVQQLTKNLETARENVAAKQTQIDNLQKRITTLQERVSGQVEKIGQLERQRGNLKRQIQAVQESLGMSQAQITAMESSKFWKLRKAWVRVRRKLKLTP